MQASLVSTSTPHCRLRIETLACAALPTTPSLGTTHSATVDVGFGRMKATILVRGERPCRETKVVFEAQASEQKLEEMG